MSLNSRLFFHRGSFFRDGAPALQVGRGSELVSERSTVALLRCNPLVQGSAALDLARIEANGPCADTHCPVSWAIIEPGYLSAK